jgi:hypothetical protein
MAERPPGLDPLLETTVDDFNIDETAPPQKSPLKGVLPFGPRPPAQAPFGDETAPPQKSPLAAVLPFRHGRPAASTVAITGLPVRRGPRRKEYG